MAIRYLDVKVRLDFGPDLSDEDRKDIADAVVSDMQYSATNNSYECDFEARDVIVGSEWSAK
jgi:hypothetical protein